MQPTARYRVVFALLAVAATTACSGDHTPTAPTLASVSITGTTMFSAGQSAQLTATALLSNGTLQNVTANATWVSSLGAVAAVSGSGIITANGAGEADIRATYQSVVGLLHITVNGLSAPPGTLPPSPSPNPAPPPAPTPGPPNTPSCGDERWEVKTLTDPDALRVDFGSVIPITVSALNVLQAHCSNLPDARTFAEEFRVYEITGRVSVARNEDDHDVHVVLVDLNDSSQTIVTEVVDPSCAATSPFISTLTQARAAYEALTPLAGKTITVRGVGFYDFAHGQTGRSLSCIELHPITSITVVGVAPAPTPSPTPTPTPAPSPIVPVPPPGSNQCIVPTPISASCGTATAVCNDRMFSCSQSRGGSCSSHGGVSCWICPGPLC